MIDPYLIKLDKMEVLQIPAGPDKAKLTEQMQELEALIEQENQIKEKYKQERDQRRSENAAQSEQKQKAKEEKKE